MPNWLHNYFVRYGNSLITRGFIGLALLAALIAYSRYSGEAMRAPLWLAALMALGFVGLILTGASYRTKTLRSDD